MLKVELMNCIYTVVNASAQPIAPSVTYFLSLLVEVYYTILGETFLSGVDHHQTESKAPPLSTKKSQTKYIIVLKSGSSPWSTVIGSAPNIIMNTLHIYSRSYLITYPNVLKSYN